ncbi:hypothetical protein H2198_008772 [Neophaeococcomyces mojaviensis]|uniref:Uncharacterized protein n=1 Tax=Neophaeococcomyces mojaviensis TaxID=3383035 RepID=A0ACC2ZWK8_9EURO|nr:hypothetical protein H2198_008772 [Knufia sp. JES_112]
MPVTTRNAHLRNGTTPEKMVKPGPQTTASRSLTEITPRPSPYLLLIYPFILALGSLYSAISPVASIQQETPLAAGITSEINAPHIPVNYFSSKRNLVNLLFVKRGWFWTSLALLFLQLTSKASSASPTPNKRANHYLQAFLRYCLLTLTWVFVTQWFFGPPLVDRSFTLTGGHCEGLPAKIADNPAAKLATIYSGSVCKAAGGYWRGGHDISGHVFMLVLSSASLLYEMYLADRHSAHPSVSPRAAANVAHDLTAEEKKSMGGWESETEAKARMYARYFLYGVVALDCLMLLTTAIWFHTWMEKLNGMLIAGIGLWVTYFIGDFVPAWREVVGGL